MLTNLLIRFKMNFIFLFYSLPSNSRFKYSYWFLGRALINMKFNFIPWPSKSLRFLTYHHFVKFYKRLLFWMKSNCKLKIQKQKLEKNLRYVKFKISLNVRVKVSIQGKNNFWDVIQQNLDDIISLTYLLIIYYVAITLFFKNFSLS